MPSDAIISHDIAPNILISILESTSRLDPEIDAKIDDIWQAACSMSGDTLFNGVLYSVLEITPDLLTVTPTEYKKYYAQIRDPELSKTLAISPLACSGVLKCKDGFIFARRSEEVTLDRGLWELAPSGTFDEHCLGHDGYLDAHELVRREMEEELGIPRAFAQSSTLLAAIEDTTTHAIDLIVEAQISMDAKSLFEHFQARQNDEYSEVAIIADQDIPQFIALNRHQFALVSLNILEKTGLSANPIP